MEKRSCYKCKPKASDVQMRQCDYHLCDKCESQRRAEIKEIEKTRKSNILPSTSPTGLDKYVASLKYPKRKYHTRKATPSTSAKPIKTMSNWTVTETPDKNLSTNCTHKDHGQPKAAAASVEMQIMPRNSPVLMNVV